MKAWRLTSFGIDHLKLKEIPQPRPKTGEVLVKVHAVSLNYRDLLTVKGLYNPRMALPRIPCSDGAGEVIEVGDGVKSVRVGERVAGIFMQNWLDGGLTQERSAGALGGDVDGMLAEHVVLGEQGVVPIPERLSYEEAATLPCAGVTAWNAVIHAGQVKAGDVVVIQGTGGVSVFALQFARMLGAKVLGTSSSDEKLEKARSLGLSAGLNYKRTPEWSNWVREQTGNTGADLIVEVGGMGTLNQSLRAARIGGVIAQIGVLSPSDKPVEVAFILRRMIEIKRVYVGSRAHFMELNRAIEENGLNPVVSAVFPFERAREALKALESASHVGKIVIHVVA